MESKMFEKGEGLLGSWNWYFVFDFIELVFFFHSIPSVLHFCLFMVQRIENKTFFMLHRLCLLSFNFNIVEELHENETSLNLHFLFAT